MIIKNIKIKNLKSFGNDVQELPLDDKDGNLILLSGKNGSGKCVEKSTLIDIEINDLIINSELIKFLETTVSGNKILLYIKESNNILYEKIQNYKKIT